MLLGFEFEVITNNIKNTKDKYNFTSRKKNKIPFGQFKTRRNKTIFELNQFCCFISSCFKFTSKNYSYGVVTCVAYSETR